MDATVARDPLTLKGDLILLEELFPNAPGRCNALGVGIARAVLRLADEVIHGLPTDLQGNHQKERYREFTPRHWFPSCKISKPIHDYSIILKYPGEGNLLYTASRLEGLLFPLSNRQTKRDLKFGLRLTVMDLFPASGIQSQHETALSLSLTKILDHCLKYNTLVERR